MRKGGSRNMRKRKNAKKENYLSRIAIEIDNSKKHITICSGIILLYFLRKVKSFLLTKE